MGGAASLRRTALVEMMMQTDAKWMRVALEQAARGQETTHPNPMVGAVVVSKGKLIAAGHHHRAGGPHAELEALRRAGKKARGATLYVTLEPCRHFGRTPPCTLAILGSGVRRVVAAMKDPSLAMQGKSLADLRAAGIQISSGVLEEAARELNEVYLTWRLKRRPYVTVKVAHSLDGKIATSRGQSQWISGPLARKYTHRLRAEADAIAVGVETVLKDDPRLTCRGVASQRPPLKVVLDSHLHTPARSRIFEGKTPVLIATTHRAAAARQKLLEKQGAEVVRFPEKNGRVDLSAVLRNLAGREISHLLIEGGGELIDSALKARAVDRWISVVSPVLIGGRQAPTAVDGEGIRSLSDKIHLEIQAQRHVGQDWIIEAKVRL